MKIIGITGKSGAGKSTLANFFGERSNVGVIHLDNLLNTIKEERLKFFIKGRNKDNAPKVLDDKSRFVIHNNRFLFRLSMFLKKMLVSRRIKEELNRFKLQGKDAVVIEGIHLKYITHERMFDKIVYVRRPYKIREKALMQRDGISKAEIIGRDLPYKKKFSSLSLKNFDYVIDNSHGKEELREAAQRIYDEVVGVKTFNDRYVFKGENLKRTLSRNRKVSNSKLPKLREDREQTVEDLFKQ